MYEKLESLLGYNIWPQKDPSKCQKQKPPSHLLNFISLNEIKESIRFMFGRTPKIGCAMTMSNSLFLDLKYLSA